VSLTGLDAASQPELPLTAVYVERALAPTDPSQPIAPLAAEVTTLTRLVQEPGARIHLTGGPGLGKTTALRRLALACAARTSDEFDTAGDLLDSWHDAVPVPILLEPGILAAAHEPDVWLRAQGLDRFAPDLERLLAAGECLLLADSLDTTGPAGPAAVAAGLEALLKRYPGNRFVIAARAGAPAPPEFASYTLPPLDKTQINEMVARWLTALTPADSALPDRITDLQGRILPDEPLFELASWPLALALCIVAATRGTHLPQARDEVYTRLLDLLLDTWGGPQDLATLLGVAPLTTDARLGLLHPLALELQERFVAGASQPPTLSPARTHQLLSEALAPLNPQPDAADKLLERCLYAGLLEPVGDQGITLPWRALREHLAGRALVAGAFLPARVAALCSDQRWHGTLRIAVREQDRRDEQASFPLIGAMMEAGRKKTLGLRHAASGHRETLLAAACLRDLDAGTGRAPELADELRRRLLALLGEPALPLPERIEAGLLLGEIGDPRFDDAQPPTVPVDGGVFVLGADVAGFEDEGPPQRIDVPSFKIGVYPVTNREYARFLEAMPQQPHPRYWLDPRFNNPSLPVVGVTWHDASAFCGWLTVELAHSGRLPPNTVVRLPLEAEWEKAATWGPNTRRKRVYPWGDTWDQALANTAEGRRAWLTTPAGCFPGGVSQYGAHDMVGNVWEWTASEYASYPGAALPQHQQGHYVLRGSSCVSLWTNARATYRGSHLPPHYWRYHLGFRIVIGRPLPPREDTGRGAR
jgi:gamma-glutamyl hercynylcysteine S-oxide synthase